MEWSACLNEYEKLFIRMSTPRCRRLLSFMRFEVTPLAGLYLPWNGDSKNAHLLKLDKASENLKLFKADLLDCGGLFTAIDGYVDFFPVASPLLLPETVKDPERELVQPVVTGTKNALNACVAAKVKKVVMASSVVAVVLNPNWPKDWPMDEESWSELEACKAIQNWYCVGKKTAE